MYDIRFNASVIEDIEGRASALKCEKELLLRDLFDLEIEDILPGDDLDV